MKERLHYLYTGYKTKSLSLEELRTFLRLLSEDEYRKELESIIDDEWLQAEYQQVEQTAVDWDFMFSSIINAEKQASVVRMKPRTKIWAAAAAVILLVLSGYFLVQSPLDTSKTAKNQPGNIEIINDVQPANGAVTLTLANGETLVVDSLANGSIVAGATRLIKGTNVLNYENIGTNQQETIWNTVSTPRGKQFQLVLSDGSKVWLNAASSVRYPVAFTGAERRIEVTGEVYLQVAKDVAHPFIATAAGVNIEVLGTEFNINAYGDDDAITTTLVEGKVAVGKGSRKVRLMPRQQAFVPTAGDQPFTVLSNIDTEKITAWKEGVFYFDDAGIKTILREISRWYDVEISFDKSISPKSYFVIINRSGSLSSVLTALKATDLRFRIEGKKLFVYASDTN